MSAMNVYASNNDIFIVTDTYCHFKDESMNEVPLNFVTKVFVLPHLNCCFCSQGIGEFALAYFTFIQRKVIAIDIESLVDFTKSFFSLQHISELIRSQDNLGTIFLFGLNNSIQKLETYKIWFDTKKLKVEKLYILDDDLDRRIICKPSTISIEDFK